MVRGGRFPLASAPAKVPKVGEPAEPPKGRVFRAPSRLREHPLKPLFPPAWSSLPNCWYGKSFTATLADNSSAEAFAEYLSQGDLTLDMHDYGSFEKVADLPRSFPRNDTQIDTDAGDIILYQGKSITIYYDKNSWNFTRLGKIDNVDKKRLKQILGDGNATVTFSVK